MLLLVKNKTKNKLFINNKILNKILLMKIE